MEERAPRSRRSTKKRDTYSPSRFDTPTQRQPRKSANTVNKAVESLPALSIPILPSTSSRNGSSAALPMPSSSSLSVIKSRKSTPKVPQPASSRRPRSLLKLASLPPKEEIFVAKETTPVEVEAANATPPLQEEVFIAPTPPRPLPFDFSNPTAHDLPDRRNKSKSVYQMGLLPRTVPVIRKSRNRSKGSQPPSGDEGSSLSHSPSTTTKVKQPPTNDEEFNALPAASFSPSILTSSVSKTGAKRGRKSNPFALEPASSSKGQRLALSKISSPLPKESIKRSPPSSKESATSSTPLESKESTPAAASVEEETIAIKDEPSIPLAANILPTPPQEEYFVAPLPPKPVPFDFNNPTANELPERRNKSKSVFEIAPQLAKKDTVRRPRKQSLKKISASENETFGGIIYDTVKGASADLKNIEGEKVGNINDGVTNAASASSSNIAVADKKKKRKRKRPLRLTMKKKKISRASMAVELFEDEVEDGSKDFENVEFDDEISEEEVIAECELEDYGANSSQYLSNLHPNVQASLKPYEQDDGSYFTRFVLYGNAVKEENTVSEEMVVDKAEYPLYLNIFVNCASEIIGLCNNLLMKTGAVDVFPTERMNIEMAIKILETKFNKENLCEVFIYGLSEINKIVLEVSTHKLPLPQMYVKCRDIATLIAHSFITYPTKLLFIFHQLFLTHLDVDALVVYSVLCRYVNQVFKIANVLREFSAPHLNEINTRFVDTIKQNIVDPFREMIYKVDREFLSKDVVVVALVCNDIGSDQYLDFQKLMLWFNTGFRKMGATVESLTLSADWNNPELLQISAYNAIAMVQSYFKFIIETYPSSKLIVVNYGDPSTFFYHAIHFVERISGVINIAFSTSTFVDEVEHIRGGVEDSILNMTYCPSLFVTGEKAEKSDISHYDQILKHYKTEQAGLIIVGDADDVLNVSSKTLLQYRITPACVKRILLEHFADFIEKCIVQPLPPRTYFPSARYVNDPDFELYNVVKEEITAMHMKLFEQTKNFYDIRADLSKKLIKIRSDVKVSPSGLSKEETEGQLQSMETKDTIEKFSQALVNLKFS